MKEINKGKFKREIANDSKDHLILEQGSLKDVTKNKYKRSELAKIPSKHEAEKEEDGDIEEFDLSSRKQNGKNGKNGDPTSIKEIGTRERKLNEKGLNNGDIPELQGV